MRILTRLLREPLLHFLAIGGLIFLLFGALNEPRPGPTDTIVVGPAQIEQLANGFQAVWRRPPTEDELRATINEFVREEIYYREALALGLDRGDTIVRRRLRQKMEFLTDIGADLLEPAEGELEAYFAANEQTYRRDAQLTFEQVYLGETPPSDHVADLLSRLQLDPSLDPSDLGERTLLPARLRLSPPRAVDDVFGKGFFERIADLPVGIWTGPVASSYGLHLVHIGASLPARTPPLEDVRDAVLRDWKAARAAEIRERYYAQLRERYVVEIQGADARTMESR
ncbi:MAG: peptidyl-prolyl cis-trans isomerase [Rhodospirillales bacterium]|nr:MAG: peptidyl-prolyl cis-trans isomerase [Rhodospirillales bacterium]